VLHSVLLTESLFCKKKTIRAIHSLPYNDHTREYFKSANILNVAELFNLKIGIHMYNKFTNQNF